MSYLESLFSLEGKTAIVTGGGHGIGKGMAEALLKAGATVVIAGRNTTKLDETSTEFQKEDLPILTCACDVTDADQRRNLIEYTVAETGAIDVLVNNAGSFLQGDMLSFSDEVWNLQHELLLKGPFHLCQMAARHMIEKQSGSIINITSVGAKLAWDGYFAYNAFKAGLAHLTSGMALAMAEHGIRVNAIGPGYFHSSMTKEIWDNEESREKSLAQIPLRRFGDPCDLAGTLLLLASDAGSYITGQSFYVEGGTLFHW